MKYQEFVDTVKNYMISQQEPSHKVLIQPVLKNNGTTYDGLIIIDPYLNISPTIYLNPYYHRYLNGIELQDIYDDILKTYEENLPTEDFDISLFQDFSKAKERIVFRLVSYSKNLELLEHIPYVRFHDLAIIFVCGICDFTEEYATILIHNQHLSMWNISTEDLYQIAVVNSVALLPYQLITMEHALQHLMEFSPPFASDIPLYILTNQLKIHGASCIIYPNLLSKLAEEFQDNLIIIPSSIHETLIIPESKTKNRYTLKDFEEMILDINETQLTDDEVLSDHPYLYIRATSEIIY